MKRLVLTEKEARTPGFRMELDPGFFSVRILSIVSGGNSFF